MTLFDLSGRVAVVTGASRGIGAAIAQAMVQQGAKVVLTSRKQEGVNAVAQQLTQAGGEVLAVACHVGKPPMVDALFQAAVQRFGQVDILVNNAGTNPHFGPLLSADWGAWDKTFEVNLKGYFTCTRKLAEHLAARGAPGAVVNIASILGIQASPLQGVYGMTKAAVVSMTKTLAVELGPAGVRVNSICPGLIDTRLSQALVASDPIRESVLKRTPAGRIGQPEDVAGAAVFLASDQARYITGETLVVDGGMTLGGISV